MQTGFAKPKLTKVEFKERLYRRRYLVPNLVTLGNMFYGFLAIIYAASGRYEKAAIAIGVAIILDGLDGRVARRLNATSKFGVEFDSLSDLVSFGVAPAMLMYHWCFRVPADEFGVMVTFIYALCGGSRLARFNISPENLKGFTGLPIPGAAAAVGSLIYFFPVIEPTRAWVTFNTIYMLLFAYLMVSNIEYYSIKKLRVRDIPVLGAWPFGSMIVLIGGALAFFWYTPHFAFMGVSLGYALHGPVLKIWRWFRGSGSGSHRPELQEAV